jgi:quercetin dioxygenase-like cupin family protein
MFATRIRRLLLGACLIAPTRSLAAQQVGAAATDSLGRRARVAFERVLPPLDGAAIRVMAVEVTYAPGGHSPAHRHLCPVIGYVVAGAVRVRLLGERDSVYTTGQTFYEPPGGVHLMSMNESRTNPATLLAFFVCDRDAPLSVPPPTTNAAPGDQH